MGKPKLQINLEEQAYKGESHLIRCGFMFVQQASLNGDPSVVNAIKSLGDSYSGIFSRDSLLSFFNTSELKTEIKRRTGLPCNSNKEERKKHG